MVNIIREGVMYRIEGEYGCDITDIKIFRKVINSTSQIAQIQEWEIDMYVEMYGFTPIYKQHFMNLIANNIFYSFSSLDTLCSV